MTSPKRQPQPGAEQRDQWRKAIAAHNKAKRNARARPKPKPITGVVILPTATTAQRKPDHADD